MLRIAVALSVGILLLFIVDRGAARFVIGAAALSWVSYILVSRSTAAVMRGRVHARISSEIERVLAELGEQVTTSIRWGHDPTLLAVLRRGELLLIDKQNGFDFRPIPPASVAGATVARTHTAHSKTTHSGSTGVGVTFGSGLTVMQFGGSSSKTRTDVVETATLEIRVQRDCNGPVLCHAVPFGKDVRAAETWATIINRLSQSDTVRGEQR